MTSSATFRIAVSMVVRNSAGEVLLVREADDRCYGKYNLPGGHLEDGESAIDCAVRELREETGLAVKPIGLIGVYFQDGGVFIVFLGEADETETYPGDDILACEWRLPADINALSDVDVLRPKKLKAIMTDVVADRLVANDVIRCLKSEV